MAAPDCVCAHISTSAKIDKGLIILWHKHLYVTLLFVKLWVKKPFAVYMRELIAKCVAGSKVGLHKFELKFKCIQNLRTYNAKYYTPVSMFR